MYYTSYLVSLKNIYFNGSSGYNISHITDIGAPDLECLLQKRACKKCN